MSNLYFDWPAKAAANRFVRFDTVRAADFNNAMDELSAGLDKLPSPSVMWGSLQNYADDTGTANTYVVAIAAAYVTSYAQGLRVRFKAGNSNTGASTLNVNGLGAKAIVGPDGATALAAGSILAGQMVEVTYDGLSFQLSRSSVTFSNDPTAIQKQSYTSFATAGTATAYTLTPTPAITGYATGLAFDVAFHAACGDNPSINISGKGAITLLKRTPSGSYVNLRTNDIPNTSFRSRVVFVSPAQAVVEDIPMTMLSYGAAGGTADAITCSAYPAVGALTNGWRCLVQIGAGASNTATTPTFSPNGMTAKQICKAEGALLQPGDIRGSMWADLTYDSALDKWVLGNPSGRGTGSLICGSAYAQDAGGTTTSTTVVGVGSAVSYTPKMVNSFIEVTAMFQGQIDAGGGSVAAVFQMLVNGVGSGPQFPFGSMGSTLGHRGPVQMTYRYTNSSLGAKTFQVGASTNNAAYIARAESIVYVIREYAQ